MYLQDKARQSLSEMKLSLENVTLAVVDTTPKASLASHAISKCMELTDFGSVKFLTSDIYFPHSVKINPLVGIEDYSNFCIRELWKYIDTPYVMLAQADGYLLNEKSWTNRFFDYDFIGSPWLPSNVIGNGGWSFRSRKLLVDCAKIANQNKDSAHPEDAWISIHHRKELQDFGCKFAPLEVARKWGFEGRSYDSVEWQGVPTEWNGELGFHSWLTKFPASIERPKIFHHSGDIGDILYSLPIIKHLGGGVIFISIDNRYPYPLASRWARMGGSASMVDNLRPLLEAQDYVDRVQFTHGLPFSTDYDLNKFREPWQDKSQTNIGNWESIFNLHAKAFNVNPPQDEPWITVKDPIKIEGRPIVVNRTERYQNEQMNWPFFIQKYGERMVFIGTEKEHELFQGFEPSVRIPHYQTKDLLEAARVIAGAKVFMGNQSACLAIAHGLCKNVIVEEWLENSNCRMARSNAIYFKFGNLDIPISWLL